jgi:hypothetical protein
MKSKTPYRALPNVTLQNSFLERKFFLNKFCWERQKHLICLHTYFLLRRTNVEVIKETG